MRSKTVMDLARADVAKLLDLASDGADVITDRVGDAVHVVRDRVADLDLDDLLDELPIPAAVPVIGRRKRRFQASPALWVAGAVLAAGGVFWFLRRRKAAADDRDLARSPSPVGGVDRPDPAAKAS